MIITREYLDKHRTPAGAFTRSQVEALGVSWPPTKGWMYRIVGNEISPEKAAIFEAKVRASAPTKIQDKTPEQLANALYNRTKQLSYHDVERLIGRLTKEKERRLKRMENPKGEDMSRTRFEANQDKRANVNKCEKDGVIAGSMEVRMALMEKVKTGELTLEEVQNELRKIQRNAKKNGKITRNQAFIRG
jgi:dynactin complex subunit